MYARRQYLGGGWWGLAPAPVAQAILVGAATVATGGAATPAAMAAAGMIKDKPKGSAPAASAASGGGAPVGANAGTNFLGTLSNSDLAIGAASIAALLVVLAGRR